jgi:hypothetical protein
LNSAFVASAAILLPVLLAIALSNLLFCYTKVCWILYLNPVPRLFSLVEERSWSEINLREG